MNLDRFCITYKMQKMTLVPDFYATFVLENEIFCGLTQNETGTCIPSMLQKLS